VRYPPASTEKPWLAVAFLWLLRRGDKLVVLPFGEGAGNCFDLYVLG